MAPAISDEEKAGKVAQAVRDALRATTKGNLPRVFVYRFIGQMVAASEIWGAPPGKYRAGTRISPGQCAA